MEHLSLSSPYAVASWKSNGAESINGDTENRIDRTEAGRVVQRQPQITQSLTQRPRLHRENIHRVQWHRNCP